MFLIHTSHEFAVRPTGEWQSSLGHVVLFGSTVIVVDEDVRTCSNCNIYCIGYHRSLL